MIQKCLGIAFTACAAFFLFQGGAQAKTVNMGSLSRSTVGFACERGGGRAFGTNNGADQYGCSAPYAFVICADEVGCVATVNDLTPISGNSIDSILAIGRPTGSQAVKPLNARIEPRYKP